MTATFTVRLALLPFVVLAHIANGLNWLADKAHDASAFGTRLVRIFEQAILNPNYPITWSKPEIRLYKQTRAIKQRPALTPFVQQPIKAQPVAMPTIKLDEHRPLAKMTVKELRKQVILANLPGAVSKMKKAELVALLEKHRKVA